MVRRLWEQAGSFLQTVIAAISIMGIIFSAGFVYSGVASQPVRIDKLEQKIDQKDEKYSQDIESVKIDVAAIKQSVDDIKDALDIPRRKK